MYNNTQAIIPIQPWIEVKIGSDNQIRGFDDFVKEIGSIGSVHIRKKWYPACCTGLELSLVIKVGAWLASAWLSGKAYDLMKIGFNKLVDNLCKLFAANSEDMELQTLTIDYDDTTLRFVGISAGKMAGLAEFFNSLPNHLDWLNRHGIKDIDGITLPLYGDSLGMLEEKGMSEYDNWGSDYFNIWHISYDFGCNQIFYDSKRQKLL